MLNGFVGGLIKFALIGLIGFIFKPLLDKGIKTVVNRKTSKRIRYPIAILLLLIFLFAFVLIAVAGIDMIQSTASKSTVFIGVAFIVLDVFLVRLVVKEILAMRSRM